MTRLTRSPEPRRRLYRRSRQVLVRLLVGRLRGRRPALERAAKGFLRDRPRSYLAGVVGDRGFARAAAASRTFWIFWRIGAPVRNPSR